MLGRVFSTLFSQKEFSQWAPKNGAHSPDSQERFDPNVELAP